MPNFLKVPKDLATPLLDLQYKTIANYSGSLNFPPLLRYQVFFKEPGLLIQWDGILLPFRGDVWLTIIFWLIGFGISLKILHYLGLKYGIEDDKLKHEFDVHQCLFLIISAFLQQGKLVATESVYQNLEILVL